MTYGRIGRLRKVVGYAGVKDPNPDAPHPDNDGIFLVDLITGQSKLIASFRQVYDMLKADHPELADKHIWSEHAVFNRSDTRFLFLARTWGQGDRLQTGMCTANLDGSDLRQVIPYGKSVSHFDWRNDEEIVATFNLHGQGAVHVLFTDGRNDYRPLGGGRLDFDGHCTFSPDQRWLATDRGNSRKLTRSLLVYDTQRDECTTLADARHEGQAIPQRRPALRFSPPLESHGRRHLLRRHRPCRHTPDPRRASGVLVNFRCSGHELRVDLLDRSRPCVSGANFVRTDSRPVWPSFSRRDLSAINSAQASIS